MRLPHQGHPEVSRYGDGITRGLQGALIVETKGIFVSAMERISYKY